MEEEEIYTELEYKCPVCGKPMGDVFPPKYVLVDGEDLGACPHCGAMLTLRLVHDGIDETAVYRPFILQTIGLWLIKMAVKLRI